MSDDPKAGPIRHWKDYPCEVITLPLCIGMFGLFCYSWGGGTALRWENLASATIQWVVAIVLWIAVVLIKRLYTTVVGYYVCLIVSAFMAIMQTLFLITFAYVYVFGFPT